jgi:hypothetical protein
VFKSLDSGDNWAFTGLTGAVIFGLAINPSTPTILYAGSFGLGVYESTDRGVSWNPINTGLTNKCIRALLIDPQNPAILYVGTQGDGVFAIQRLRNPVYLPLVLRN